jgi:hypothetical protein
MRPERRSPLHRPCMARASVDRRIVPIDRDPLPPREQLIA